MPVKKLIYNLIIIIIIIIRTKLKMTTTATTTSITTMTTMTTMTTINNTDKDKKVRTMDNTEIFTELINKQLNDIESDKQLQYGDLKRICKYINTSIFDENKCFRSNPSPIYELQIKV